MGVQQQSRRLGIENYRRIEGMRKVLMVEQDLPPCRPVPQGGGRTLGAGIHRPDGHLELASLEAGLALDSIYEDVEFGSSAS